MLSHRFKPWGWLLSVSAVVVWVLYNTMKEKLHLDIVVNAVTIVPDNGLFQSDKKGMITQIDLVPNLAGVMFLVGGLFLLLAKEKREDEYINAIRLNALHWAVTINYVLLLLCFLLMHGFGFLNVMLYNMFTVFIIYIARFQYLLFHNKPNTYE
jgi:hypothetical protein